MKTVELSSGRRMPVLGQGTWRMGENRSQREAELAALRLGLELGVTLIDTAEMYGEGGAEEIVGEAIAGRRDEVFLVSKVYPHNASATGALRACERSLRRLKTEHLDLYLLHWRGSVPLPETLEAFHALRQSGKIRDFGVSNFDCDDMVEASALPGGEQIATNQVLYNLTRRGIEWDLLPWCREHRIPIMAYSPIEQGRLRNHPQLDAIARRHDATASRVALAWLLRHEDIVVIPKATSAPHVRDNRAALDLRLTPDDLAELERAFPPPRGKRPLDVL